METQVVKKKNVFPSVSTYFTFVDDQHLILDSCLHQTSGQSCYIQSASLAFFL